MMMKMYKTNQKTVSKTFKFLNKRVFDGVLVEPDWDIYDFAEDQMLLGYYCDNTIGLVNEFFDKSEFVDTLCHEMTHMAQEQVFETAVNHGSIFKKIMKYAREQGAIA